MHSLLRRGAVLLRPSYDRAKGAAGLRPCIFFLLSGFALIAAKLASAAPAIDDETRALLTEVQRAGVRYFYDFGHPVSGLARVGSERPPELCAIGGTGWGFFNLLVAAERGFVPRADIVARVRTTLDFLATKADRFHGVFPHWINGETGKTIPFNKEDDGGDLVETAFLAQGLLALREYFRGDNAAEAEIRARCNELWRDIEWDWFARDDGKEAVLRWHWSPQFEWKKNFAIRGFNETHVIYLLALASPTHSVAEKYYWQGWQGSGERFLKPRDDFGIHAELGRGMNMPLFFAHYSYLGFDPRALRVAGKTYFDHLQDICRLQVEYAKSRAADLKGYGPLWGLTSCRGPKGYKPYSPGARDDGTIAPTAALSSLPYVPEASIAFLRELQKNHRRLWGEFGYADSFNLAQDWIGTSYLGNNVGPIAPMIENHLSGLCWQTFMHAPEIAVALKRVRESEPKP
jgi:exo beta-1,2-glucooligosaccharide sophorohydrolase (non-reducing end)